MIESFDSHRAAWAASFDVLTQAEHSPEIREVLANGYARARRSLAALIVGIDESEVDDVVAAVVALAAPVRSRRRSPRRGSGT